MRRVELRSGVLGLLAVLVLAGLPIGSFGQVSGRADGMRFLPNVEEQFVALTQFPEPISFHIGGSPDPSSCRHYQGMTRIDGPDGTPFFIVTRSGNTPNLPGPDELLCDDSDNETRNGHLVVFRMDSRDKNGERMRSNRLARGLRMDQMLPPLEDKASIYYTVTESGLVPFDGDGPSPPARGYQHPGGMQLVGKMLAVALETPRQFGYNSDFNLCFQNPSDDNPACIRYYGYERAATRTLIQFYDMTNPEAPEFRSSFVPRNSQDEILAGAGVIGVTELANGKYLMMVTGGLNTTLFFYRSKGTDLASTSLDWDFVGSTPGPDVQDAHQTMHFLREGSIDGPLFLAGARGKIIFGDRERLDLYRVNCGTIDCDPGFGVSLDVVRNGRRVSPFAPASGVAQLASLAAGSDFYISPSGELIFYAMEHDNDGPDGVVKAGEWRHKDVVREGSPTLLPTAVIGGPYEVDEGSTIGLTGSARHPITKPWIQFFHEDDFGGRNWIVDYDDYAKDDFDNFRLFERLVIPPSFLLEHNDKARSWKSYSQPGCSIRVNDYEGTTLDETKTLNGTGSSVPEPDLATVLNDGGTDDIDAEADSTEFLDNCGTYYATPVGLLWDVDVNGSFETAGNSATFDTGTFDGPSNVAVPVRAVHPSAPAVFGSSQALVTVKNVAPTVSAPVLTDSGGNVIGTTVPFVILGTPVMLSSAFTDPGRLDRQTAAITWGDGTTDLNSAFVSFDEAFGDGTGSLVQLHNYLTAGTFSIGVGVADDDGGAGQASTSLRVLTPSQALAEIITMLDAKIAACGGNAYCSDLGHARVALAGSNANSNNGALNHLDADRIQAARAFLAQAATWLERATANGATDLGTLRALVEQVEAAL
jgi:hypothetical protein